MLARHGGIACEVRVAFSARRIFKASACSEGMMLSDAALSSLMSSKAISSIVREALTSVMPMLVAKSCAEVFSASQFASVVGASKGWADLNPC